MLDSAAVLRIWWMNKMNEQRVENDMFDTMWAFLEMGSQKANYPALMVDKPRKA